MTDKLPKVIKPVKMTLRISPAMKASINQLAAEKSVSQNDIVRMALFRYIRDESYGGQLVPKR